MSGDRTVHVSAATTETAAVAQLVLASQDRPWVNDAGAVYHVLLEPGQTVETVDKEHLLSAPRRATGVVHPSDLQGFRDYVGRHDGEDTTVWLDRNEARIVAVINDHQTETAGWGDHRAVLQLERTPEWKHWTGRDGKLVDQESFAEHVQQGIGEIIDPEPATMLEVAQSIQGSTDATWRTAKRLDTGEVGFEYTEQVQATAGRHGTLAVPAGFTLLVSPFYGEPKTQLAARLRYRVNGGHLTIGYQLIEPHKVELAALTEIMGALHDDFANVYMGTPRP
jgi:uncharacterized protein YfdQ (DUF2303 family)